jgi:hypothetical protein
VNYSCIAIGCWVRSRMLKTSCRRRGSRAWEKRATLMSPASYRAWLYRIATNLCLTTLARAPRRSLPPETRPQSDPGSPCGPESGGRADWKRRRLLGAVQPLVLCSPACSSFLIMYSHHRSPLCPQGMSGGRASFESTETAQRHTHS